MNDAKLPRSRSATRPLDLRRGAGWIRAIDQLFRREEIHGGNPGYLHYARWTLFRWGDCAVYLHHFTGSDLNRDPHDHPKRFVSIGLWGRYLEESPAGPPWPASVTQITEYRAPWLRTFPATHRHRLMLQPGRTCWTLCLVGGKKREWGFWQEGEWVPWHQYVARNPGAGSSAPHGRPSWS